MRADLRAGFTAFLLTAAGATGADQLFLVADIDPEPGQPLGSMPALLAPAGDFAVFSADVDDLGRELYSVDASGEVRLLRDLCPGLCNGFSRFEGVWSGESRLYFVASDDPQSGTGRQAWVTDGTAAGTRRLSAAGLRTNPFVGSLQGAGGEELTLFEAVLPDRGFGLWRTDGTQAGTRPLGLDAEPDWPLGPYGPVVGGESVVFGAFLGEIGSEPWVTDGTDPGTLLLGDLRAGEASSIPHNITRLPGGWLMVADDEIHGEELWFSDGTPAGTRLVADLAPGPAKTHVWSSIVVAGGAAYFIASLDELPPRQLWRSDGSVAGTEQLTEFPAGTGFPTHTSVLELAALDDAVLFAGDDGAGGLDLWRADAGGVTAFDLCPGACSSNPGAFRRLGDSLIFIAEDGVTGVEPWISDGTRAGTRRIADLCPGACDSPLRLAFSVGDRLFFRSGSGGQLDELWATDGSESGTVRLTSPGDVDLVDSSEVLPWGQIDGSAGDLYVFAARGEAHGTEPWGSDGTPEGTRLLADLLPRSAPGADSDPRRLTTLGDELFFVADDGIRGPEPWISDGTPQGTRLLAEIVPGTHSIDGDVTDAAAVGDRVFFVIEHRDPTTELWVTDGQAAGTLLLLSWEAAGGPPAGGHLSVLDGSLIFRGDGGLWRSDGTVAGTVLLRPLVLGAFRSPAAVLGGELFFAAAEVSSPGEVELWASDGTAAGTRLVRDLDPLAGSGPGNFRVAGGQLYFSAYDTNADHQLWVSDGTAAGTRVVPTSSFTNGSDLLLPLAEAGGRLVFAADDFDGGGIWATDGSAAGTERLIQHRINTNGSLPAAWLSHLGERLYLWLDTASPELWSTDGTAGGTRPEADLLPANASVSAIASLDDRLLLSVFDPTVTVSQLLFTSDGTPEGLRPLAGATGVELTELTRVGELAFLPGRHPQAGLELMAFDPARLGGEPCSPGSDTLCLADGRFSVQVDWRDHRSGDEGSGGALPLVGSDRTGLFWFFDPANVELVVKVLDGTPVNGFWWAFYGALSDVEYTIDVTDTETGRSREYHNPPGEICGRGDTTAFPTSSRVPAAAGAEGGAAPAGPTGATASDCGEPEDLCLLDDRFRVEVTWRDQRSGDTGVGTAIPPSGSPDGDESGLFWFFNQDNVELVVKVLDGRPVNGRFWVFYGALSDVEYTITVTDTETGAEATYTNPPGEICGRGDTTAF